MSELDHDATPRIGRYLLREQIAAGGMATIHLARLVGDIGFSRIVAAKRLRPELATDDEFVAMFLDEARVASKVHHRNVVPVLDVVTHGEEVVLVQDYVHGVPLAWLLRTAAEAGTHVPVPVAVAIACHVLAGLQAAHDTLDELGQPLEIVHRDVSPQNVIIAVDGTARLLDFGVAKAADRSHVTRRGTFKGKLCYAAPEQLRGAATRQTDVYATSIVLWELLAGQRMHHGQDQRALVSTILAGQLPRLTEVLAPERPFIGPYRWQQLERLEGVLARGLATQTRDRWASAAALEEALTEAVPPAGAADVAAWLHAIGQPFLDERAALIAADETSWRQRRDARRGAARGATPPTAAPPTAAPREAEAPEVEPPTTARLAQPSRWRSWHALTAVCLLILGISFAIGYAARDGRAGPAPAWSLLIAPATPPTPRHGPPAPTSARPGGAEALSPAP